MVYTVALTGGIGSGKSVVSNTFMQYGITIIDSDIIARKVVKPNTPILYKITKYFGTEIINTEGSLNRRMLRERIFSLPHEKDWVNALLHPLIYKEAKRQIKESTSPYVLWVVPLLVENKLYKKVDRVLLVDTEPETQIRRTMMRDKISQENVEKILLAQVNRESRLNISDDIINNNGTLNSIKSNVAYLHQHYLIQAKNNRVPTIGRALKKS